jgi:flagellar FliL protein
MSSSPPPKTEATEEKPAKKAGKGKLIIIIAVPVVLLLVGAGLWFTGVLPHMLGMEKQEAKVGEAAKSVPPSYLDIPEMIANLNNNMHKIAYVKVTTHLHLLSAICQGGSSTGFPARALLMAWRAVRPCRRPVAMTEAAAA